MHSLIFALDSSIIRHILVIESVLLPRLSALPTPLLIFHPLWWHPSVDFSSPVLMFVPLWLTGIYFIIYYLIYLYLTGHQVEEPVEGAEEDEEGGPDFDYLLGMKMWSLTLERKQELLKQRDAKLAEVKVIEGKTPSMLWTDDLDFLLEVVSHARRTFILRDNACGCVPPSNIVCPTLENQ